MCIRDSLYFLPVSDAEKEAFEQRFGVSLMNTYGSTESIGWVLTDPPTGARRWPSGGRAGLGYEVRITREDGTQADPGEVGEIQVRGVRGRTIMKEYFNDPEATARTFTEAAVIGVADPIRDQAVKAFVLPAAGARITEEEVLAYCEEHMAGFKVPSYVEIVDSFPRTCSMKIEAGGL